MTKSETVWHVCGTPRQNMPRTPGDRTPKNVPDQPGNYRAGDGNRTRMTSLEGVWRTGVRAAELETLMLLGSRGCLLITVANGPLMARRSWPSLGQVAI
jgi:hypothetical protein